jgi:ribonuclease HI
MSEALQQAVIYTDGACHPNPGPGGWAALLMYGGTEKVLSGHADRTTNNRMELTAAVQALLALPGPMKVVLYTDSTYLQRGISEWLPRWMERNWRTTTGEVANLELWQALVSAADRHKIDWRWVRGHATDRYNQRVDMLARKAIRNKN